MAMLVLEFRLPEDVTIGGKTSRSVGPVMNIDPVIFKKRSWRSVAVFRVDRAGIVLAEHFHVVKQTPTVSMKAQGA